MHQFLLHRSCHKYFGVDPWNKYDETDPCSQGNRKRDRKAAEKIAQGFSNICKLLPMTSKEASKRFRDNSIQLVYIDGNHQPEYVREDLNLWWPKVAEGGFLAGHDIICPHPNINWGRNIQPLVFSFCRERDLDLYLVTEPNNEPWSYYFRKQEG